MMVAFHLVIASCNQAFRLAVHFPQRQAVKHISSALIFHSSVPEQLTLTGDVRPCSACRKQIWRVTVEATPRGRPSNILGNEFIVSQTTFIYVVVLLRTTLSNQIISFPRISTYTEVFPKSKSQHCYRSYFCPADDILAPPVLIYGDVGSCNAKYHPCTEPTNAPTPCRFPNPFKYHEMVVSFSSSRAL